MPNYDVPALGRADLVLDLIVSSPQPLRAADVCKGTGLPKSTVHVLIEALLRQRWIERSGDGYAVGPRLFELGSGYLRGDRLIDAFRASATSFVEQNNEVVRMAVLDGAEVMYIAREDAHQPARLVSDVGSRRPAHCTALGRALLASYADDEVRQILPRALEPLTPRTITDIDRLLALLGQARATGWATEAGEVSNGLTCFAAYVGQLAGRRIAVSTSAPLDRLDGRRERKLGMGISRVATQIAVRVAAGGARRSAG